MIGWIARHWPFANGAGRIVDRFGRGIDCGRGTRQVTTSDGFAMSVMADDLIGRHLIITGRFDRSLFEVLLRCGRPGDHVLDVGSNIGYVSCLTLQHLPDSRVISIEPQHDVAALLRQNLGQFEAHRWQVEQAALSDEDGEGRMHIDARNRGASALADEGAAVRLVDVNAFLESLDRLDAMKVDIEGHEETLFRAGRKQLERLQPRVILFEDEAHAPGSEGWIDEILESIGYDMFGVQKSLFATRLVAVSEANRTAFHDYLAVSRARHVEIPSLSAMIG
jgi:FkbM family methyltransferase